MIERLIDNPFFDDRINRLWDKTAYSVHSYIITDVSPESFSSISNHLLNSARLDVHPLFFDHKNKYLSCDQFLSLIEPHIYIFEEQFITSFKRKMIELKKIPLSYELISSLNLLKELGINYQDRNMSVILDYIKRFEVDPLIKSMITLRGSEIKN